MLADSVIRAAAVGGVAMVWTYFTLKALKLSKQIINPPEKEPPKYRCEYCRESFLDPDDSSQRWALGQAVHVCKRCAGVSELIN